MKITVLLFAIFALLSSAYTDSLLKNGKFASPVKQYKKTKRKRPTYDFKIHDTVMVNVNIDDTIQFSKKQDYKRDVTWLNAFKNYITHFGGVNAAGLPNVELESKNQFKSKGQKQGTSKIRLEIPCEIIEILPNGDLVLDGARSIKADETNATIRLGGRVNPKYISSATDIVYSERILSLKVLTDFEGPLGDNEKRGFVTRFLDKFKIF